MNRFAIAVSAPLLMHNGFVADHLYGGPPGQGFEARAHMNLVNGWDVFDDKGLESSLTWLLRQGHRERDGTRGGFDFMRIGFLARCGLAVGHFDEARTWKWLEDGAALARRSFNGWRAYGDDLILGAERFDASNRRRFEHVCDQLDRSLWAEVPW